MGQSNLCCRDKGAKSDIILESSGTPRWNCEKIHTIYLTNKYEHISNKLKEANWFQDAECINT